MASAYMAEPCRMRRKVSRLRSNRQRLTAHVDPGLVAACVAADGHAVLARGNAAKARMVTHEGWPRDLPGWAPPESPPHPQGAQEKGAEEHDYADEQQVQQALRDYTHDAQHHRHDHQKQEEHKHLILRSVRSAQRRASRRSPSAPCS